MHINQKQEYAVMGMTSHEIKGIDPAAAAVCAALREHGHEAYLVGGALRDLLRGAAPKDWDVATSALPDQVLGIFPRVIPTGVKYGTVTVLQGEAKIEVTAFRSDGAYSDGRHPDRVVFGASIEADLARRDFTINAMAYDPVDRRLVDPFGGRQDLRRKILRTVGPPADRFTEDALRMVRYFRFLAVLELRPDSETVQAMRPSLLALVSPERIRDEMNKLLPAAKPVPGLQGMADAGLLAEIVPELLAGQGLTQGSYHRHDVMRHAFLAVEAIRPVLVPRLAALLHDVAKPSTRREDGQDVHFYGHDAAGAAMAEGILSRLRYPNDLTERITGLIRLHMFQLPIHPTGAALRRLLRKAGGPEPLRDLVELRRADIVATGRSYGQAAQVWRELKARVEEVIAAGAAFSLGDLAIGGDEVMRLLGVGPGPEVGRILNRLLEMVLEEPALNTREKLLASAASFSGRSNDPRSPE